MKRSLLLLLALVVTSAELPAQDWLKVYGGPGDQLGYAIEPTADGGFLVGGNTTLFDADAQSGYWVARFDSTGGKLWENSFTKKSIYTKLWALRTTRDQGMLLAGFNGIQFGGGESALLYKVDSGGKEVWEKEIDYPSSDHAHFLLERKSYGYYMGGHTDSKDDPTGEMWLMKLDDDRNVVWEKVYKLNYAEHAHAGQETPDGGCILVGHTSVNGLEKIWAMRVDSNGATLWSKVFSSGDEYHDSPYYTVVTRAGGFAIFGGSSHSAKPFGTGWLIVTDADGNVVVDRHFGRQSFDTFFWSGRQTSDGGYILAGYTSDSTKGEIDMYVVKTDSAGEPEWDRRIGAEGSDEAFGVIETPSGYIVSGQTTSPSLQVGSGMDLLLARIDKHGAVTSLVRSPREAGSLATRAYPNPVSGGSAAIEIAGDAGSIPASGEPGTGELAIVDQLGNRVRTLGPGERADGGLRYRWDLRDDQGREVPAGLYLYRAAGASGTIVVAPR